ncbi:hypothetical protein [Amycolatopsis sp. WQ 127309]|uniref:hypothetical protein n=1 Tax=Amycolatopsis sp. WQ 127309 TaxID=2932773 RepID=UPI001FF17B32|nr:hypothetical protein [Amycolatopsis sp. WQ 127309]UOZ06943.1 hypothetical protein MUY22_01210 [Amycolatopsis sp. WQ 127309]
MKAALRIAVAAGLLGSAGVHLYLSTQPASGIIGPLFLLNAIAGPLIAIGLLFWRHRLMVWLAVDFGVATLGAYTLGQTIGVFADMPHFSTPPEYLAAATEAVCVVGGALLLFLHRRDAKAAANPPAEPPGYVLPILLEGDREVVGRTGPWTAEYPAPEGGR